MTWLSISLKNAAACDKWYQLQNLSITESLNANGAWEKLFVSHPRACHTQCRTNKNPSPFVAKKENLKHFLFGTRGIGAITKSPSTGEAQSFARGRLAWCLLCACAPLFRHFAVRDCRSAVFYQPRGWRSQTCSQKETLRFPFLRDQQILILFTDLSMAGLPAELKHITQRRKRKQP